MAKAIAGKHEKIRALARKLAPGRDVTGITICISPNAIVTATVAVIIDESELESIVEIAEAAQPRIVEVPRPVKFREFL